MIENNKLVLEILTGPLDGHIVTLKGETKWTQSVGSLLSFPWDDELGQPQGRFIVEEGKWLIEPFSSPHGTYILNKDVKLPNKTILEKGDLLKASRTWMLIKAIE